MSEEPVQIPPVLLSPGVFERITRSPVPPSHSLMARDEATALLTAPGTEWFLVQATQLERSRVARLCRLGMPWPLLDYQDELARPNTLLTSEQTAYLLQLFEPQAQVSLIRLELRGNVAEDFTPGTGGPARITQDDQVDEIEHYIRLGHVLGMDWEEAKRLHPPEPQRPLEEVLQDAPPEVLDWWLRLHGQAAHQKARARWELIENISSEPPNVVQQVALGLCRYIDCIGSYIRECDSKRTKRGEPPK